MIQDPNVTGWIRILSKNYLGNGSQLPNNFYEPPICRTVLLIKFFAKTMKSGVLPFL